MKNRADWFSVILLFILPIIFFWRIIFLGHVLLPADVIFSLEPWKSEATSRPSGPLWNTDITDAIWQYYPMGVNAQQMHREGAFLWDPYPMAGMPSMARGEVFANPILILFSQFMPVSRAFSWMAILHLWIASIFMFLLLREMSIGQFGALAGSLAFAYNAFLVDWMALPNLTNTMAWLPVVAWGIERALRKQDWRWSLAGALGFAFQILSGQILWPLYAAITLTLLALYRGVLLWFEQRSLAIAWKPALYTGISLGIGALLVAPPWLLTTQLYFHTWRTQALWSTVFLDIRTQLIRLLSPTIYGTPLHGDAYRGPYNYTETTLYFGVLSLFLVAASLFSPKRKLVWGFFGIGLFSLLAVYYVPPFRQIIALLYPIFLNAYPGRIFYVTAFTWAVAAGFGADWLGKARPSRVLIYLALVAGILAAGFGLLFAMKQISTHGAGRILSSLVLSDMLSIVEPRALINTSVLLLICAGLLIAWGLSRFKEQLFMVLSLAVITADLFIYGIGVNPAIDPGFVFPETASLERLSALQAAETQPERMLNINSGLVLFGMSPQFYRLPAISGYSSWVLQRFAQYADLTHSRGTTPFAFVYFIDCCHPLIDALNVKYVYVEPDTYPVSLGFLDLASRLEQATLEVVRNDQVFKIDWNLGGEERLILFEHPPARIDYNLFIQRPVILTTAIAIDPAAWEQSGDGVQFEIYATPSGGNPERFFSRYIDPKHNPAERTPIPVQVDLSPYQGQQITLSLVTTPGSQGDDAYDWAGWVEPRLQNYAPKTLELVYDGPNKIYRNTAALPRAWIVHQIQQVPVNDIEAVKEKLADPHFDPASQAVVETDQPIDNLAHSPLETGSSQAMIKDYTPEKIVVEASLQQPGLLVLSDVMYPGWKAFVDGEQKPILTTNLVMRGVLLEAGNHQVVFVFQPALIHIGLVASVAALVGVLVAWVWLKSRSAMLRISS